MGRIKDKKGKYFTGFFTLLELMALLAVLGIVLTLALHYFF